eukprot:11819607-Alexandrium_andersonii.AAC.1
MALCTGAVAPTTKGRPAQAVPGGCRRAPRAGSLAPGPRPGVGVQCGSRPRASAGAPPWRPSATGDPAVPFHT